MAVERWIRRVVDDFWAAAGEAEPFPRDLEAPALWALPVTIVKIPRLGLASVREWLEQCQRFHHPSVDDGPTEPGASVALPPHAQEGSTWGTAPALRANRALDAPERGLHGCLVVYRGEGIIFLDGADPADERRLSLAHELAHFLAEYHVPRTTVARRLGADALAVLDNHRPPTAEERVDAAVLGVALAPHVHLLARDATGAIDRAFVYSAEWRAHRLALELLAPAEAVWARLLLDGPPSRGPQLVRALAGLLVGEFGLPSAVAERYARDLAGPNGEPTARSWLGFS